MQPEDVVAILETLHRGYDNRGYDSYIGFARKTAEGRFENLFSVEASEVRRVYPYLAPWLARDAYFTVNGMYRAAPFINNVTEWPGVWRKEKHLRYLNACYVDLDVGRTQGSPEQRLSCRAAVAHLNHMMEAGELPRASILAESGRGLYAFWLLHDEDDPSQPPRCWPDSLALYKSLQRHITRYLEHLAADVNAVDAARVLRVPGTVHGNTGTPAFYQFQIDAQRRCRTYSMRQLAAFFSGTTVQASRPKQVHPLTYGVDWVEEVEASSTEFAIVDASEEPPAGELPTANSPGARDAYGRPIARPGDVPARVKGARTRAARRAQDVAALEQWRGGWSKGGRRFHLSLYAGFLRAAGLEQPDVLKAVEIMAANCRPPYPSDLNDMPLHVLVVDVFRAVLRPYSNASLCRWLQITPDLARELALRSIVPAEVRAERTLPPGGQREIDRQARLEFLRTYTAHHGCSSARHMVEVLKQAGLEASRRTVNEDLNALGYSTAPARRAGRPSHGPVQAQRSPTAQPLPDLTRDSAKGDVGGIGEAAPEPVGGVP
jgi:hypothetical protein